MNLLKANPCGILRSPLAKPADGITPTPRHFVQRNLVISRSSEDPRESTPEQKDTSIGVSPAASVGRVAYPLVTGLAAVGMAETTYLTVVKLLDMPLVCPVSGCETVMSSSYSTLFGLPLSFFGMLAYGAVGLLAATATGERRKLQEVGDGSETEDDQARAARLKTFDNGLMAGASLLAGCSGVLMYLLHTQFGGEPCMWCYLSAAVSVSLLGVVASGMNMRQLKEAAGPGLGAVAAAVLVLNLGFGGLNASSAANSADFELEYYKPDVTTKASSRSERLAKRLQDAGAKMYGAFWCTHCYDQKQTFGQGAMKDFPYVECYPDGWKKGVKVATSCDEANVRAFPTWVINGKLIEGELSLDAVEAELEGKGAAAAVAVPAAAAAAAS